MASYIYREGTTPNTQTVISSKVKVYAVNSVKFNTDGTQYTGIDSDKTQVGVMASFDPSESRSAQPVRGIGFGDQVAEVVPNVTDPMTISVSRAAQYATNLYQAFGYKGGVDGIVRSLKHHRWPFDVNKEIVVSWLAANDISSTAEGYTESSADTDTMGEANLKAIKTVFEACWFTDWSTSYTSDTAIVQEQCTLMCSDVHDGTAFDVTVDGTATGNQNASVRTSSVTQSAVSAGNTSGTSTSL